MARQEGVTVALKCLDLGCGAGGTAYGYERAGYSVTGVDIVPQPRFPFEFHLGSYLDFPLDGYDLIHVSPPCQRWTRQLRCRPEVREQYPDHITPMRARLRAHYEQTGTPYVIENVEDAPLVEPVMLCGWSFGYEIYRHRFFETSCQVMAPRHRKHVTPASKAGHWRPGTFVSVSGHCSPMWLCRQVMDIDWMRREELAEAVPPYFTEYLGLELRAHAMAAV